MTTGSRSPVAFAKRSLGQYQAALADYSKAIELNPLDFEAFDKRGYTYSLMKQWQNAITDYKAALAIQPGVADTLARLRYAQQQIAPPPAAPTPTPPPPAPLINTVGWIIIGAVIFVIIIVALLFWARARARSRTDIEQ